MGIRRGTPERATLPGLTVHAGLESGAWFGQFTVSYRLKSPQSIRFNSAPWTSDEVHQSRYAVSLAFGVAPPPLDAGGKGIGALGPFQIAPFAHVGPELQQFDSWTVLDDRTALDLDSVETANWDVGAQLGAGLAFRYRRVGVRCSAVYDLRPRPPFHALAGQVVVVFRPG